MISRLKSFCGGQARRLIAAAVLLAFVAALLPLPIPQGPANDRESSEPFPCQHHQCGCRTAEQCWKKCCCFTNAQKVAWARSHRVQAPDFVIAAARTEARAQSGSGGSCCRKAAATFPVASTAPARSPSAPKPAASMPTGSERPARQEMSRVLGFRAQECQGQVWGWSVLSWSILTLPPRLLTTSLQPPSWPFPASDRQREAPREPPVPPPRVMRALVCVA